MIKLVSNFLWWNHGRQRHHDQAYKANFFKVTYVPNFDMCGGGNIISRFPLSIPFTLNLGGSLHFLPPNDGRQEHIL